MKIAVTSQDRKTITKHAGKCRNFWVYEIVDKVIRDKRLLELPLAQSFHESNHTATHPLDDINQLITGSLGLGLQHRLQQKGIAALATAETDPDRAVAAWLEGNLIELPPDAHDGHEQGQEHGRSQAHNQSQSAHNIAFGPIPSRRLGHSLGINNIPAKHCSYSCIYCQIGTTSTLEITPRAFFSPHEILHQVAEHLDAVRLRGEKVDYLSFVPDGEPTLDNQLGDSIDALRELGLPIAVISNATLISREDVRTALSRADWVSLKVDSVDADIWRRINRPHPNLQLADILDGIHTFARTYTGKLASETMLLAGINDSESAIQSLGHFLTKIGMPRAYLAIPHRPPAISGLHGPDEQGVTRAYQILKDQGVEVELLTGYEGEDFASSGDFLRDLLAITAVHPLRESAVSTLAQKAGSDMSAVTHLLKSGELQRVHHAGETFYIRRFQTALTAT